MEKKGGGGGVENRLEEKKKGCPWKKVNDDNEK